MGRKKQVDAQVVDFLKSRLTTVVGNVKKLQKVKKRLVDRVTLLEAKVEIYENTLDEIQLELERLYECVCQQNQLERVKLEESGDVSDALSSSNHQKMKQIAEKDLKLLQALETLRNGLKFYRVSKVARERNDRKSQIVVRVKNNSMRSLVGNYHNPAKQAKKVINERLHVFH